MADVQGMDALLRRMKALGEPRPVLRYLQLATIRESHKLTPRKTGFLQRSTRPGTVTATSAQVVNDAPYAVAVHSGTKAHVIVPKRAKALAWGGARRLSGRLRTGSQPDHFAMRVHHPGTKAQPFLLDGAKKATQGIGDIVVKAWNDAA